jgi:lactose/L-arabinose transport system permease protein
MGQPVRSKSKSLLKRIWQYRNAYLFIAPFYIGFLIFGLFPLLFSAYISFHKWSGFDTMQFRGLANYSHALQDDRFLLSMGNMVYLWLGHIFIMLSLALLLAVALNSKRLKGREVYRAIFYLPNVSAIAAMALVFGLIFDTNFGILNMLLGKIGLPPIPWLSSTSWSKPSIILFNIWNITGWYMIILLAGLQSIDPLLYEAAEVDGANPWHKLRYITIPSLRGVLFFCFIIETIGSFEIFTEPYVLTRGGPQNSSLTPALYLYQSAFEYNKLGYASALSFVLFAAIVVATVIQTRFWRERGPRGV